MRFLESCFPCVFSVHLSFEMMESHSNNKRTATGGDISPVNHKKTNVSIAEANGGLPVTPQENLDYRGRIWQSNNYRYLPYHFQEHLVYSSVDWRWRDCQGKKLDKDLYKALFEDRTIRKSQGTNKSRKIDLGLLANILWSLLLFLYSPRKRKTMCTALVQCIFRVLALKYPEYFSEILLAESILFLPSKITLPYKFQRTIDTQPTGGLNYESCNSIRSGVEELRKHQMGIIPCGTTIARTARKLEQHAASEHGLAIEQTTTNHGPVFSFEFYNLIRLVIKSFGLQDYACTGSTAKPVMLTYTLDGAQLTNELGHLTGGFKIVDPRAIDPLSGIAIAINGKWQSRDLCFVTQLAFVKDSKAAYNDCFAEFFERFNGERFVIPATDTEPELSNFDINSCQDLSSGWKATKLGGGCKSTNLFCCHCMVSRDTSCRFKSNDDRCNICVRLGIEQCFCHDVVDKDILEETKRRLAEYIDEALDDGYRRLDYIAKHSEMIFDSHVTGKETMTNHIDYEPDSKPDIKRFESLLNEEIKLRFKGETQRGRQLMRMDLQSKRQSLKEVEACESAINQLRKTVVRHEETRILAVALAAWKLIPCLLHMKMRVCEKVFHYQVNDALD